MQTPSRATFWDLLAHLLAAKLHRTASCRHAEKAQVCVPVFVEGWQRGQSHNQGPKDNCK